MNTAYRTELEAVRTSVYAALPGGMQILASVQERQAAATPKPAAKGSAEAVIAAFAAARDPANQKSRGPGMAKAIMLEQIARGAR
ncbi:MAG: hypothetical protein Q7T93_04315 [Methylobacterium sp.]|uniref:hypothetical protein n=1 Tax=Methylobacterium sp. TaxID=409 RepID=UPI002727EC30|nr:hypothetical protein [Methylobacterium sp.]MDO9426034.1 hypothetical protein [Methylobacterium sp.]